MLYFDDYTKLQNLVSFWVLVLLLVTINRKKVIDKSTWVLHVHINRSIDERA